MGGGALPAQLRRKMPSPKPSTLARYHAPQELVLYACRWSMSSLPSSFSPAQLHRMESLPYVSVMRRISSAMYCAASSHVMRSHSSLPRRCPLGLPGA